MLSSLSYGRRGMQDLRRMAYSGLAQFGSHAGVTIALPRNVAEVGDYTVTVIQGEDSGFVGDVRVEKSTNGFTVYNSGSEATSQFEYLILYRYASAG